MDRKDTILSLAGAMGIKVQREQEYTTKYDHSTGTYYCGGEKNKSLAVGKSRI